MKKALDKLLDNIKFDKKYVLFSLILVILGIVTGSIFVVILNSTDKNIVIEYIESFVESFKNGSFNYLDTFKNSEITNIIFVLIITIIGFTYFLFPIIIIILFYKAFIIGFSLSSFILTYKLKGLLLSVLYIFPHMIINILLISLLVAFTLKLSITMIKCIIKKKEVNMRQYFNKNLYISLITIILMTLTALYESFVLPLIFKGLTKVMF